MKDKILISIAVIVDNYALNYNNHLTRNLQFQMEWNYGLSYMHLTLLLIYYGFVRYVHPQGSPADENANIQRGDIFKGINGIQT